MCRNELQSNSKLLVGSSKQEVLRLAGAEQTVSLFLLSVRLEPTRSNDRTTDLCPNVAYTQPTLSFDPHKSGKYKRSAKGSYYIVMVIRQ